jgi:RNA recognition motif-containing protein
MNLYVSNLSPTTSEKELDRAFSEFGIVVSTKIIVDPATGMPKGFGFVQMSEKNEGKEAIINLDMTFLDGTIINVKEANVTKSSSSGGNFRTGGGDRNRRPSGGSSYSRERDPNAPRRAFNSDRGSSNDRPYNTDRRPSSDRPYNTDRRSSPSDTNSEPNFNRLDNKDNNFNTDDNKWNSLDY